MILEDGYYRALKEVQRFSFFSYLGGLASICFLAEQNFKVYGFWRGLEFSFGGRTCLGSKFDILGLKGFEAYYYII